MARDERTRPTRAGSGFHLQLHHTFQRLPGLGILSDGGTSSQCAFAAALLSLLFITQQVGPPARIILTVDRVAHRTVTAQRTVGAVLVEVGIAESGSLTVEPSVDTRITPDMSIVVQRYHPLAVALPDREVQREVQYEGMDRTPLAALHSLDVVLGPRDLLRTDAGVIKPDESLTALRAAKPAGASLLVSAMPLRIEGLRAARNPLHFDALPPVRLVVDRALPIVLHERTGSVDLAVRGATVREALADAGIPILGNDLVLPNPDVEPRAGLHVFIERAKDLTLKADGKTSIFRSRAPTVQNLLTERGISLRALDQVTPELSAPLSNGTDVQVVRVREEPEVEEEVVPFGVQRAPTAQLGLGEKRVVQGGSPGVTRRFFRVRYEDGEEVARQLTATQAATDPRTEVIEFGTRAPSVDTSEGPREYTRKLRVLATWYNSSHGGKPLGSPGYGITALGLRATHGVMAVDPRVIPYWTKAYVPGYGIAVAGDTGGGVKGNHIDLAFDEDAPVNWSTRSLDIYLLGAPTLQDALRAAFPND